MRSFLPLLIVFICFSSCNKHDNATKEEIIFMTYGELPPANYISENDSLITKKFSFKIERIGGCNISNTIISKAKRRNTQSDAQMKSKYGNDWIKKLEKETGMKFSVPFIE